jgi:hypothetical protein
MKILNLIVPNYILYIIGIIVVVSAVFLPILFTVILPKLQNNNANTTPTNTSLINLRSQNAITTANATLSTPPTTTTQLILLNAKGNLFD